MSTIRITVKDVKSGRILFLLVLPMKITWGGGQVKTLVYQSFKAQTANPIQGTVANELLKRPALNETDKNDIITL